MRKRIEIIQEEGDNFKYHHSESTIDLLDETATIKGTHLFGGHWNIERSIRVYFLIRGERRLRVECAE